MRNLAKRVLGPQIDRIGLHVLPNIGAEYNHLRVIDDATWRSVLRDERESGEWPRFVREIEASQNAGKTALGFSGTLNLGDRRALYSLVKWLKPASVLEIGTHLGSSTLCIAAALKRNASDGGALGGLTTVDAADVNHPETGRWRQMGADRSPRQMIQDIGMDDQVSFVTSDSIRFLRHCDQRFDFVFLDGSHAATWVYREVQLVQPLLNPDAVVLLHDYFPDGEPLWPGRRAIPGPAMAIARLLAERAPIRVSPLGALPWPTKEDSSVTSLALLGRSS